MIGSQRPSFVVDRADDKRIEDALGEAQVRYIFVAVFLTNNLASLRVHLTVSRYNFERASIVVDLGHFHVSPQVVSTEITDLDLIFLKIRSNFSKAFVRKTLFRKRRSINVEHVQISIVAVDYCTAFGGEFSDFIASALCIQATLFCQVGILLDGEASVQEGFTSCILPFLDDDECDHNESTGDLPQDDLNFVEHAHFVPNAEPAFIPFVLVFPDASSLRLERGGRGSFSGVIGGGWI